MVGFPTLKYFRYLKRASKGPKNQAVTRTVFVLAPRGKITREGADEKTLGHRLCFLYSNRNHHPAYVLARDFSALIFLMEILSEILKALFRS